MKNNESEVKNTLCEVKNEVKSEVKRNYVMALKVAPKVILKVYIHESGHFRSLRISDYQNIPLSYKIRLNQVSPANKIHPHNHFSDYFLYFCRYIALI